METGTLAKVSSLIISLAVIVLSFCSPEWYAIGIYEGAGLQQRMAYSFFHANVFHALINVWCLLAIVFRFNIRMPLLIMAYVVAVFAPNIVLGATPTVGLSAICFFLLGSLSFRVADRISYQFYMLTCIFVGLIFPNINIWIHFYCYAVGVLIGLISTPLTIWIKK